MVVVSYGQIGVSLKSPPPHLNSQPRVSEVLAISTCVLLLPIQQDN